MVVLVMTSKLLIAGLLVITCGNKPFLFAEARRAKVEGLSFTQAPTVVRVTAERFAFSPSEIVVERGTVIEFHLTSDDTDHGFRIVGTDVNAEIPKRRRGEAVVKYVADTVGRFVIECSRPCGAGHTAMRATLVVK
jgi:cytochrome c oxidase subunit II